MGDNIGGVWDLGLSVSQNLSVLRTVVESLKAQGISYGAWYVIISCVGSNCGRPAYLLTKSPERSSGRNVRRGNLVVMG